MITASPDPDRGSAPGHRAREAPGEPGPRTYRRSAGTRLVAVVCAALFVSAAVASWITSGFTPGTVAASLIALLSLANLVTAWADLFTLSDEGIESTNLILERLGRPPRRFAWSDIVSVRGPARSGPAGAADASRVPASRSGTPRALFLVLRNGRRIVLDSLERYDEVLGTVLRRCGAEGGDVRRPDH